MSATVSPNAARTSPPPAAASTAAALASPPGASAQRARDHTVADLERRPERHVRPDPPPERLAQRPVRPGREQQPGARDAPPVPPTRLPSPHRSRPVVGRATGGAPRPTRPSRPGAPRAGPAAGVPGPPSSGPGTPPCRAARPWPARPVGSRTVTNRAGGGRRVVLTDPGQHASPRVDGGEGAVHVADDDGRAHAPHTTASSARVGTTSLRPRRERHVRPRRVARSPAARARTGRWSVHRSGTLRAMAACPACMNENPEGSRFCNACGASIVAASPAAFSEERKVVSALFCDLVGFTATSEAADPEDVDRMLGAYFAMARGQIEAFGGIVEKFIGDAVVGVFGVPAAHEDDPERAVRAALRIAADADGLRSVGDEPLRLRIGINTGEALVRARRGSRLRRALPDRGRDQHRVAHPVGRARDGRRGRPGDVRGDRARSSSTTSSRPPPSRARPRRSRCSTRWRRGRGSGSTCPPPRDARTSVARSTSRSSRGCSTRRSSRRRPQLVTVIGEPGLGKSRIVAELFRHVDERPDLVTWRQGRCLPYGDGITFWALGEIVKAHAGILESDDPPTARGQARGGAARRGPTGRGSASGSCR